MKTEKMKRIAIVLLSIAMIVSMLLPSMYVFANDETVPQTETNAETEFVVDAPTEEDVVVEKENEENKESGDLEQKGVDLDLQETVNGVTISVKGHFASPGILSVKKVKQKALSEDNVAKAYSFDIKVLNENGEEMQPEGDVDISFEFEKISKNLDVTVYHEKKEIESEVAGDSVNLTSDGFSVYTVEFTYEDKEYVLEGDSYVKLSDLLSSIGLTGKVTEWKISNEELFTIYRGTEEGVSYKYGYDDDGIETETPTDNPDGNVLYMVALQMFDTEEWLDVTIDGIEYHIIVTDDAYVNGQTQTKITDSRVEQGGNETNFTATMPLASIFVDEDIVNMDSYKLLPPTTYTQEDYEDYVAEHGEDPSWNVGDVDYDNPENTGKMVARLVYDTTQTNARKGLNVETSATDSDAYGELYFKFGDGTGEGQLSYGPTMTDNFWNGPVVEYRFINAAERFNTETQEYERMDVVITYSNIHISLQNNLNSTNYGKLTKYRLLDANKIQPVLYASTDLGGNANDRTGLKLDVNIQVVDKKGELIPGSYYFPLVDADIMRTGSAFGSLYQATTSENNRYSEQFVLLNNYGQPTATGEWEQKIWIPGGDYNKNKAASQTKNMPYLSNIDSVNGSLRIKPGTGYSSVPTDGYVHPVTGKSGRDEDFYTGFATLANNTKGGVNFRYWGTSAYNAAPGGSGTVTSYVLAGTQKINHKLDASSDEGGTIYTTTTGNADGSLSGGELMGNNLVNTPHQISTATGQHVTYTMTPKGGYRIKNVYVKRGDIDVLENVTDGHGASYEVPIEDLGSKDHGVYTYTFTDIQKDNSIHVEWEKTNLSVTKTIDPVDSSETRKFNFQIKLWDTSTEDSVWRVRARKYNGTLIKDTDIIDGTPYYMTYHESHNEEGDIEDYVQVLPESGANPAANGWYERVEYNINTSGQGRPIWVTRYIPTEDTEQQPILDEHTGDIIGYKDYYEKVVTQGNIMRYYHHVLGYNEETGLWESYDVKSNEDNSELADLGLHDIDDILSDDYRYVEEEGKVYVKSSYDAEADAYTKYLMWIPDETIDNFVLVVGDEEMYPDGRVFMPDSTPDNFFTYVWREGVNGYSGKIINTKYTSDAVINGVRYDRNVGSDKYKYEKDTHNPVHYDFVANPENLDLDEGYSKLTGESGMYIISLPAGQTPDLSAFDGTDWDMHLSKVGVVADDFDMDAEFMAKGANPAAGVNTYQFSLAPGETIDFEGCVPMGWNYEITEIGLEGTIWEKKSNTANATIEGFDGDESVGFVNQKKLYDLTINKETVDNASGNFEFKVKVWHEQVIHGETEEETTIHKTPMNLSNQFGLPDADGYYHFNLSNGGSVKIEDILYGYHYEVIEVPQDSWTLENSENTTGTMSNDSTATFTNKKEISLTFEKEVTGGFGNRDTEFEFEVKVYSEDSSLDLTSYGGIDNGDGSYRFKLKSGEKVTIVDIPYGYAYEIKEKDYTADQYTTKVDGVAGRQVTGTLTEDKDHTFTNNRGGVTPTGVLNNSPKLFVILLVISSIVAVVLLRRKLKLDK